MDCEIKLLFKNGSTKEFTGSAQVMTCGFIEVTYQDEVQGGFGLAGVKKSIIKGFPLVELESYEIVGN